MQPTLEVLFAEITRDLPRFSDGRVDFTLARRAPVLSVIVYHDGEILILKRSDKVLTHRNVWSTVSGFIDEPKSVEEFALQELSEEAGIGPDVIKQIKVTGMHETEDPEHDREWLIYTVVAELHTRPEVTLDWEHTEFAWAHPDRMHEYAVPEDFETAVRYALQHLNPPR